MFTAAVSFAGIVKFPELVSFAANVLFAANVSFAGIVKFHELVSFQSDQPPVVPQYFRFVQSS